jgi:hypothetical protein
MQTFLRSMAAAFTDGSSWSNIGAWLDEQESKRA